MPLNCGAREDSWESCKEIKPVNPKGNQPWTFIGKTDAKAEASIFWPPRAKSWLIGKDPDAGRDWGQEEKGKTEDEMAGWHHRLDGREFEWTPGVGDGQGGLACCNSWGRKESDTTEQLNWTELNCLFLLPDMTLQQSPSFLLFEGGKWGNSMVIQWLGLGAFIVRTQVWPLIGELRSLKLGYVPKKKKKKQINTRISTLLLLFSH